MGGWVGRVGGWVGWGVGGGGMRRRLRQNDTIFPKSISDVQYMYPFRCTKVTVKDRQVNGKREITFAILGPTFCFDLIKVKSVFLIYSRPFIPPKLA